ncbi:hypothetical protein V8C86DRAFT_1649253 [Haematococcus lacustris]
MATIFEVKAKIEGLRVEIEGLEEKVERLEQSYPANEQPAGLVVELEQYRENINTLLGELVELLKYKNILLAKEVAAQVQVAAEPAYNLLHWGYNSVATSSTSRGSHKRLYYGNCELVKLPLAQFCPIVKAKMRDVTSGVTMPARVAMHMRNSAADIEAEMDGTVNPLTGDLELDARFRAVVGKWVVDVVNACILQKQPTWSQLSFRAWASPSDSFCRPDFLIKQNGADVCGGEGKASDLSVTPLTIRCKALSCLGEDWVGDMGIGMPCGYYR